MDPCSPTMSLLTTSLINALSLGGKPCRMLFYSESCFKQTGTNRWTLITFDNFWRQLDYFVCLFFRSMSVKRSGYKNPCHIFRGGVGNKFWNSVIFSLLFHIICHIDALSLIAMQQTVSTFTRNKNVAAKMSVFELSASWQTYLSTPMAVSVNTDT